MADVVEVDAETGDVIQRDFTPEERAQRAADAATAKKAQEERLQRAGYRAAVLERLGITEDEAALLAQGL
jgi:hypothetical protein